MPNPRPSSEDRLRAALWFAEHGFGVFSVWSTEPDGTCRCKLRRECGQPGKHPVPTNGFKAATTDPVLIRSMMSIPSDPNWGMLPPEGVFALDVDGDGIARLADCEARYGPLPATLTTRTANGRHVFLRWPAGLPRPLGQLFGYVTRWGSGTGQGYVIGPRSVHATGAVYMPEGETVEIATLPDTWARAAVGPAKHEPSTITIQGGYQLPEAGYGGSRYDAIRDYIASRYKLGMTREEILAGVIGILGPRFADPLSEGELRDRFERAWRGTSERLGPPRNDPRHPAHDVPRVPSVGMDAADLLELDLPPLRWIVPNLVPEGTTIIAAPPKVGKSCLIYQIAVEASIGGDLLGRRVTPGSVLYLALEDGKRRGQDRLRAALAGRTMPRGRLEVRWSSPNIGEGLEDDILAWLETHPDAVMVAIDTLGKVRPQGTDRRNAYDVDVALLARLQDLFRDRNVALIIVHHARKETHDDFLASVSGTFGLTGSADTIIVVRRKRNEVFGKIHMTGRDVADAEISAKFDGLCWTSAPDAMPEASFEQNEVYRVVDESGPLFPQAIADRLGKTRQNVQNIVGRMVDDGVLKRTGRGYVVDKVTVNTASTPVIPLYPPHVSSDSERNARHGGYTRARAEPVLRVAATSGSEVACHYYADHQYEHYRDAAGDWRCHVCSPEEGQ